MKGRIIQVRDDDTKEYAEFYYDREIGLIPNNEIARQKITLRREIKQQLQDEQKGRT